jgi:hypothetical protein
LPDPLTLQNTAAVDGNQARAAASDATAALEELGDAEDKRIMDPRLNAALNPLRRMPALEVVCGRCYSRVGWWALDSSLAYVAATEHRAKPRERLGGISDLAQPSNRHLSGFLPWIELARDGKTSVRLVDIHTSGYPIRLRFVCRCGADYTLKNTPRLRIYLASVEAGSGKIVL